MFTLSSPDASESPARPRSSREALPHARRRRARRSARSSEMQPLPEGRVFSGERSGEDRRSRASGSCNALSVRLLRKEGIRSCVYPFAAAGRRWASPGPQADRRRAGSEMARREARRVTQSPRKPKLTDRGSRQASPEASLSTIAGCVIDLDCPAAQDIRRFPQRS